MATIPAVLYNEITRADQKDAVKVGLLEFDSQHLHKAE